MVELPTVTPLSESLMNAWSGFDGTGSGTPVKNYYRDDVQIVMKKIIGRNPKFLKNINMAGNSVIAEYKLINPEKLQEFNIEIDRLLDKFLQTVPLYTARSSKTVVTVQDSPELNGYDTCNYVFTDIGNDKDYITRTMLVRYPDGSLKNAPWEVRDRVSVVYFGSDHHSYPFPKFLTNVDILKRALKLNKHLYVLNFATSVCRSDDKKYIKVLKTVFDDVIKNSKYYLLEFSPFYGPLLYHAIGKNKYRRIIYYYLKLLRKHSDKTQPNYPLFLEHLNLYDYVELYALLKPLTKTASTSEKTANERFKVFLDELSLKFDELPELTHPDSK